MSDIETYGDNHDVHYADYAAGQEHGEIEQLHQAQGSEYDYNSDFAVYEQDHEAAESTDFQQGQHIEIENPDGSRYEESNYTNYSNDSYEKDSVFAAEGSESVHAEQWSELDHLRAQFDSAFVQGTEYHGGGEAELTAK